jgi:hypothetical protein
LLPFLALPDGAHLVSRIAITTCAPVTSLLTVVDHLSMQSEEDYSYFVSEKYRENSERCLTWSEAAANSTAYTLQPAARQPQQRRSPKRTNCPRTRLSSESRQYPSRPEQRNPTRAEAGVAGCDVRCNRQILAADLLVKGEDVTRSTVQKAVVVLASRPVFVGGSQCNGTRYFR